MQTRRDLKNVKDLFITMFLCSRSICGLEGQMIWPLALNFSFFEASDANDQIVFYKDLQNPLSRAAF